MSKKSSFLSLLLALLLAAGGCSALLSSGEGDEAETEDLAETTGDLGVSNPLDDVEGLARYYDRINLDNYSKKVYIDPSLTTGNNDGSSPENAFQDWYAFIWNPDGYTSDTAYLFMRGTTTTPYINFELENLENVIMTAYGDESLPKPIVKNHEFQIKNSKDVIVANMEFHGPEYNHTGIVIEKDPEPRPDGDEENILILGNEIHGYRGGIGFSGGNVGSCEECQMKGLQIIGNHIYDIYRDGMFGGSTKNIEIAYNHIERTNAIWHEFNRILEENDTSQYPDIQVVTGPTGDLAFHCPPADQYVYTCPDNEVADVCFDEGFVPFTCPGDNIQFASNGFWIHHNLMIRFDTGNKFNILISTEHTYCTGEENCVIEHNTLYGPDPSGSGGTNLGFYSTSGNGSVHIRNNLFLPPQHGSIYMSGLDPTMKIYKNTFVGSTGGMTVVNVENSEIFNNVFYQSSRIFYMWCEHGLFRNNIFTPLNQDPYLWGTPEESFEMGNNLFSERFEDMFFGSSRYEEQSTDIFDDPKFVDPENLDFRLLPESSAIDAGADLGLPFKANAPDIGANEVDA